MRVLLIEDDESLTRVLTQGLRQESMIVDSEPDGRRGLIRALEGSYDVIVVDIMLPVLNGYRVVEELRRRRNWTPILMLTAKDGPYDQVDAFELGADDYLTKPFDFVVLVARLHALARRGAPERPTVLEMGSLRLDPGSQVVSRGDKSIKLTAKEFALLDYFMRRPGMVLSKAQILDAVWDPAFEGDDNIVEVYVRYLRKKIDDPFGTETITTLRGVGYRFGASS